MRKVITEFDDIHCHLKDIDLNKDDNRIVNLNYYDNIPETGYYSIGIHPWKTELMNKADIDRAIDQIKEKIKNERIVAIGECGIDKLKGASLNVQSYIFSKQIGLSEKFNLPLIIHNVKATEEIIKIKKELKPKQLWIIHGFRGNKNLAEQILNQGIALSYGENYNLEAVRITPDNMLFFETDESKLYIKDIKNNIVKSLI